MDLSITTADLAAAKAVNERLARGMRFRVQTGFQPLLMQTLLRASQLGADKKMRQRGLRVKTKLVGDSKVPVRILRAKTEPRGVVLDFHGGGWVIGNPTMNDALNAALVEDCGVTVVSVDYRLATRAPLQGLMDDCLEATQWLLRTGEFKDLPVIVVGESAGGHLAAATMLRLKSRNMLGRIAGAVLYYGVYDLTGTPSVRRAGPDTLVLDGPNMVNRLERLTHDMSETERRSSPVSPLFGDLDGMPPALMFVGERDPLLDDTVLMAERWGPTAELHRLPETPHGFLHFGTPIAGKVTARTHQWVRERLGKAG